MIKLGELQELEMSKSTDFGIYLKEQGSTTEERILLPKAQVPKDIKPGDTLSVFIYKDSDDRPIATTLTPKVTLGTVALLQVKEVTTIGAFLDWGLAKDLLLPFKEQTERVHTGEQVLVALYIDKSTRLCATMKIYDYLQKDSSYKKGDKVIGTVYEVIRNFGAFVAVDNLYSSLIPEKELKKSLKPGDSVEARVTAVKEDGKLDLSLNEEIPVQIDADADMVYKLLTEAGGFLPYHDKTEPALIAEKFGLSKNAFKRAIGRLMKEQKLRITNDGIEEIK
ncbi:CvfB family protein [Anaerocolumna chitinilytica]|uniref:RNA-binding protein n=1 Tax=Anaerocolumna chitinilytica TaxID=1727145 RepID=A0A7I8DG19_9FIRM|nr:S1-like domain-containing RNA-binding protein [Anaerocolumna chitinilytica]BCJ97330.1 RNA-binding protein [Anaerocolumna chitinilytica]